MKFSVSKKEFLETLNVVSGATFKDKRNPILSCIYLKTEGSSLEMQANNNNLGIVAKIPCNSEEDGDLLLESKMLIDFVKKIVGEVITVSTIKDGKTSIVKIYDYKTSFTMLTLQPDAFPKVNTIEDANSFNMDAKAFKTMIDRTAFSAATDDDRPIFTGCLFHVSKHSDDGSPDMVYMAATNTHRIAVHHERNTGINIDLDLDCIIPAQQLIELSKRLEDNKIQITPSRKNIGFTFDNLIFVFRVIQGIFPDHKKVTDKNWSSRMTIDTTDFLEAVQRVALVAKKTEYSTIKFKIADDEIEISADCMDGLTAKETISGIDIEGKGIEIAFNVKYILDVLKILDSSKCVMYFNGGKALEPVKIQSADDDDFIYIVTPVRTN